MSNWTSNSFGVPLLDVIKLLSDFSKWTQGALARDINNNSVSFDSKKAISWCLMGALLKCDIIPKEYIKILNNIPNKNIRDFNDTHTYKEVINLIRKASRK